MKQTDLTKIRKDVMGMTVEQAKGIYPTLRFRVTRRNGEYCVVTMDYCTDRVNVSTNNGIITAVTSIG